jgi:hypothetical protein
MARRSHIGEYPSLDFSLIRFLHLSDGHFDSLQPSAPIPVVEAEKLRNINEEMKKIAGMLTYDPLGDRAVILQRLRKIGKWIADKLLPVDWFKCCHNGGPVTLYLVSDQNDVPWELTLIDDQFLSEKVIHARNPYVGRGRSRTVSYSTIPRIVIIVGKSNNLPNVDFEIDEIMEVYKSCFCEAILVKRGEAVTPDYLRRILEQGEDGQAFDVIHFVGHGSSSDDKVWLNLPSAPFLPSDVPPVLLGNPLIFWNACFSASSSAFPTIDNSGILSEFGSRFIANGASHFIGALLPIQDKIGKQFAGCFYSELFTRKSTVGEAFFCAKSKVASTDPLVHTYVLYGNPSIRMCNNA